MFWLKSIYTYSHIAQPGVPPILLVGTHKDHLSGVCSLLYIDFQTVTSLITLMPLFKY